MGEDAISRRDFLFNQLPKRTAAVAAAVIAGQAILTACGKPPDVSQNLIPTPESPIPTKMPDHMPLPIVEQTIDEPVTIPTGDWDIDFVFEKEGVSTVEDGYRLKHQTQLFNPNLEGVIIDSPERNLVIVFTNGLAFDRRGNIHGLPVPWAEDRCVMGAPDKIKDLIAAQHLDQNKHVIMVEAQTYDVPGGAEWELAAFGHGIQPQRFLKTMNDTVMRPVAL